MKKFLLLSLIAISTILNAQENCETIKTENIDLKKILGINKPILETLKENNNFRITKVIGNKADKTISVTLLIEAKDDNKEMSLSELSIIDLEGNEFKFDAFKSGSYYPKLALNVPLKSTLVFEKIEGEPKIIKLLRFKARTNPEDNSLNYKKFPLEFRDLNVSWN